MKKAVRWISPVPERDDFGDPIRETFIDGKTIMGPWALMTPKSWAVYGIGRFGIGFAQQYSRAEDGKFYKVQPKERVL